MGAQITYQDLSALKEEYKFHKIIYIVFDNREFVFRSLGREEYSQIINIVKDPKDLEDVIAQTSLLYPEDYEMVTCPLAGLPSYITNVIIEYSDFASLDNLLNMFDNAKKVIERLDFQCISLIKAAMPEYSIEEIQGWTWEKIMFYTALAQKIINFTLPPDSQISMLDQRDKVEKHQEEQNLLKDDVEFIRSLRQQGIDPMFYFDINGTEKHDLLDEKVFLGGRYWQDGSVMNAIREKIFERRHRRDAERR